MPCAHCADVQCLIHFFLWGLRYGALIRPALDEAGSTTAWMQHSHPSGMCLAFPSNLSFGEWALELMWCEQAQSCWAHFGHFWPKSWAQSIARCLSSLTHLQ